MLICYTHTYIHIEQYSKIFKHIYLCYIGKKVKLATIVEGDPKAPFSTAITPRCRWECYSFPWIAPLYPWYVPYNSEC